MLILDKQKAVEHMVALTAGATEAEPEPQMSRQRRTGRVRQRIATFERRAVHLESPLGDEREARPATKSSRGIAPV